MIPMTAIMPLPISRPRKWWTGNSVTSRFPAIGPAAMKPRIIANPPQVGVGALWTCLPPGCASAPARKAKSRVRGVNSAAAAAPIKKQIANAVALVIMVFDAFVYDRLGWVKIFAASKRADRVGHAVPASERAERVQ